VRLLGRLWPHLYADVRGFHRIVGHALFGIGQVLLFGVRHPLGHELLVLRGVVQTARLVASARLADAQGDLPGAAKAYEEAITVEDALAYMEPPYWYYPIRQSLGSVYLRQGKLDAAEKALRDSLGRVQQRLGAGGPGGGLQAQGRREGRGLGAQGLRASMARRRGARHRPAAGSEAGACPAPTRWPRCRRGPR